MAPRHNVFSDCVWIPGTGRGPEQSTIWVHTPKTGQFHVFHTISVEPDRSVCSSILQPNTCGISPDPSSYPLFPPRSRRLIQSYKFTCNPQQSLKSQHNRRTRRAVEYRTRVQRNQRWRPGTPVLRLWRDPRNKARL